jgi:dTDP-4-amino-4,6-dideoxygalactose transaminase
MKSHRNVPFFNYPAVFTSDEEQLTDIIRDVARRGAFILQQELVDFEKHLAAYVGAKHVLGLANATDALHLAVRAAGIGAGDEVIFCSHTMVATPAAVHFAGATPVPVECGADHLIDTDCIANAITSRTKAIMPTQLNGRTANMDALLDIANEYDLIVIEDAAQSLGSKFKGKCAGTFGLASCISFYPAKTLGCFGDGGCVITNDDDMYRELKLLRDHGRDDAGEVVTWGLNSRLDNLQAAILDHKLKTYDNDVKRRREIAAMYEKHLGHISQLRLPPAPGSDADHFDIFQNYEIEAESRDLLRQHLKDRGVGTLVQWGGKVVHQFAALGFKQSLPRTEEMFTRALLLPMNTSLSDQDVEYVCEAVERFYEAACSHCVDAA